MTTLRMESGELATVTATTTAVPGFPHRIEVYGTQGGIQIEGESVKRWTGIDKDDRCLDDPEEGSTAGTGGTPEDGHGAVDGIEGRRSLAAVLAIYQAAGLT